MVDSSLHSTKTDAELADTELAQIELADIVRRFGPRYTSQYGHVTMPSQKRALSRATTKATTRKTRAVLTAGAFGQHSLPSSLRKAGRSCAVT